MDLYEKLNNLPTNVLKQFIELVESYKNFGLFDLYNNSNFMNQIKNINDKYKLNINITSNKDIINLIKKLKESQNDFINNSNSLKKKLNIIDFNLYSSMYLAVKDKNFMNDLDLIELGKSVDEKFIVKRILEYKSKYYKINQDEKKENILLKIYELQNSLLNIINEYLDFNYNLYKNKLNLEIKKSSENLYLFYLNLIDEIENQKNKYNNDIEYLNDLVNTINNANNVFLDKFANINLELYSIIYNNDNLEEIIKIASDILSKRNIYEVKTL